MPQTACRFNLNSFEGIRVGKQPWFVKSAGNTSDGLLSPDSGSEVQHQQGGFQAKRVRGRVAQAEATIGIGKDRGVGAQDGASRSGSIETGEVLFAEKNRRGGGHGGRRCHFDKLPSGGLVVG